jgi:hypothetical protein
MDARRERFILGGLVAACVVVASAPAFVVVTPAGRTYWDGYGKLETEETFGRPAVPMTRWLLAAVYALVTFAAKLTIAGTGNTDSTNTYWGLVISATLVWLGIWLRDSQSNLQSVENLVEVSVPLITQVAGLALLFSPAWLLLMIFKHPKEEQSKL